MSVAGTAAKPVTVEDIYARCGLFFGEARHDSYAAIQNQEHLFIGEAQIRAELAAVKQQYQIACTENDVIMAHLWKRYLPQWIKGNEGDSCYITCPVDV